MKISSVPASRNPPRRTPVWLWVIINQLAFPGLGTIMMGRRVGYVQASLMVLGFLFVMAFLLWFIACAIRYAGNPSWTEADFAGRYRPYKWALVWGLVLCAISWLWALASSIQALREQSKKGG